MPKKKGKITINKIILIIISFFLGLFFVLGWGVHSFFSNLPIKLHFCNHVVCIIFSLIWFLFAGIGIFLLTRKTKFKKFWYIPYIIIGVILIMGIIFMNIIVCDINGNMSFGSIKEMFTTYPEVTKDICSVTCKDWDYGHMNKLTTRVEGCEEIVFGCLEVGDLVVLVENEVLVREVSSIYDEVNEVYCCCYNVDTCEEFGYISRIPEADFSRYEEVVIRDKLICWKEKEIIEPKIICCEMFNLEKEKKVDVAYNLMTEDECNGMLDIYDRVDIVDESLCVK